MTVSFKRQEKIEKKTKQIVGKLYIIHLMKQQLILMNKIAN